MQRLLAKIEDFLRITHKLIAFDHLSLVQWLTEENDDGFPRAGAFAVLLGAAQERFTAWARAEVAAGRAHEWPYLNRHLAEHLELSERQECFSHLLMDLCWLEARLRWADLSALLTDWQWIASPTPELSAVERALRQGAHVLSHQGQGWNGLEQLPSQLLARLPRVSASGEAHQAEPSLRDQAIARLQKAGDPVPLTASLLASEALFRTFTGHGSGVFAVAVLLDGRLASGSMDATIKLWDPATGSCTATLEGHSAPVIALAVLPDGRLASGSGDETIKLWDPATGSCATTLEGHSAPVRALAVLPDGRLASGSLDSTIKLWDPATGQLAASLECDSPWVMALVVLTDGRLASGTMGRSISLWDPVAGQLAARLEWALPTLVSCLAVLPDGRLASGSDDHTIKLWDPATGQLAASLDGHSKSVSALAVLPDGRLASVSWDKPPTVELNSGELAANLDRLTSRSAEGWAIELWDPATGSCDSTLEFHSDSVYKLAVLPDGRLASGSGDETSGSWDFTIRLWDPASDEPGTGRVLFVADAAITTLAFLPAASILVAGDASGRLHWLRLPGP